MDTDQMQINDTASAAINSGMMKTAGISWTVAAIMAGVTLLGAGAYLAWNSRQAKLLRATRRAANVLYKTGTVLQSVAEAAK